MCRLENIEHKSMKQVSYSGKYSLSAIRTHQSHLQFSFALFLSEHHVPFIDLNKFLLVLPSNNIIRCLTNKINVDRVGTWE